MDWRIFWTAFGTIKTKSPFSIFFGAMFAFAAATLIAVSLGEMVFKFVPPAMIRIISGGIFIGTGIFTLWGKL